MRRAIALENYKAMTPDHPPLAFAGGDRMVRSHEVRRITGTSNAALHRMIQCGSFPKPIRIGTRLRAWPETQVREWIVAREAEARSE